MIDNCPFTTSALMTLRDALIAFRARKAAEKLATERAQAAYGENAQTDVTLLNPVGAGNQK